MTHAETLFPPGYTVRWADLAASSPAAEQLASLKKQLAEMQKSLEALEATLQTPPAEPTEKK